MKKNPIVPKIAKRINRFNIDSLYSIFLPTFLLIFSSNLELVTCPLVPVIYHKCCLIYSGLSISFSFAILGVETKRFGTELKLNLAKISLVS